jgi:hypothetical protein
MDAVKLQAMEDHLCDQMYLSKEVGDLGGDWVEQSHQNGRQSER